MKKTKIPIAPIPLPVAPRLLLTTSVATYWATAEAAYEPLTGGAHVRRVTLERHEHPKMDTRLSASEINRLNELDAKHG